MHWRRPALLAVALLFARPSLQKKASDEPRPLYSPWTDEDDAFFKDPTLKSNGGPQSHPQARKAGGGTTTASASELEVPRLPPLNPDAGEAVLVVRELISKLRSDDHMEEARIVLRKHKLSEPHQAETAVLLRQEFELIKHQKRTPLLEEACGGAAKVPKMPGVAAKRLLQMMGTILDKATREKPKKNATPKKFRNAQSRKK